MEQGTGPTDTTWYKLEGKCVHCGGGDFTCEYGPRHFVLCSCCNNCGTHVECFEKHKNQTLTEEFINSGSSWFCGKGCEEIAAFFETQNGMRMPVRGEAAEYTLEIVRYDPDSRGARSVVDAAVKIFRDAFGRTTMPNGKDYIDMCCTAYESPDDEVGSDSEDEESTAVDFTGFRVAALRKGNQVVTVATLRLFGTQLAEMPYVATRPGFRRAGHCRRLLKGVEDMLRKLQVGWLVLPSVKSILTMWRYSFNFLPLTLEELASLEAHIISPDFGTVQLLKKRMWPPLAGRRGGSRAGRGSRATAAAAVASGDGKLAGLGGSVRGRGGGTRGRGAGGAAGSSRGGQLQLKFGGGRRRRSRAAAAAGKADGSASDADGESSSSDGEPDGRADRPQDEESRAAAGERAAAEAAWALFEQEKKQTGQQSSSSSDEGDDQSSFDEDSDKPASKRRRRKRKKDGKAGGDDDDYKGDASNSSDCSDSDSGLVSEDDDFQRVSKHQMMQQQEHKRGAAGTLAATATASGSAGTAAAAGGSAAESSGLPTQGEKDAVLQQLRKEIEKAGGKLADGWTVRLVGKTPTGNWRTKYFVAPGGAPVFTGILAVKRHLGLAPPLPGSHPAFPGAAAATASGPCNKKQRITGPDAGGSAAGDGNGSGMVQYPQSVAKRLRELRMGRARRRHMSDATVGVGLADAVKTFYTTAVAQLVNTGSHQETLGLQQQVESLQAQLDGCHSSADAMAEQLNSCDAELAVVQAERDALQAERDAQESDMAEKDALLASQHVLINSLTRQLGCQTAVKVAAATVEMPAATAAESLPLAAEANELTVAAAVSVIEQEAVIAQLRQLLETRETEIAGLKQQLEETSSKAATTVTPPAAAAAAPLLPPLLARDVAAGVAAAGAVQQGSAGLLANPEEPWDCQEALGSGYGCLDLQDVGNGTAEELDLDLTLTASEANEAAKRAVPATDKLLECASAVACQPFSTEPSALPTANDKPLDSAAAGTPSLQPCSIEASQQCGTQTLQFSEDQAADGACDALPPAQELGCLAAATQQAQQQQQQSGAAAAAPLAPAHELECLAAATLRPQQQQQPGVQAAAPLAVLPAKLVAEQVAAEVAAAAGPHTVQPVSIAAAAHTVTGSTTVPAHNTTVDAAAAAAEEEEEEEDGQQGAAAATCLAWKAPVALFSAAAAAELHHAATAPPNSSGKAAATTACKQSAAEPAAAAAASSASISTPAAYNPGSESPALQSIVAVAAAATNRQPGTTTAAAIGNIKTSTPVAVAAPQSSSKPSADSTIAAAAATVAAAAPLSSSKPPGDPTAAAAGAASGGSRLSDSFLSGLLPDVVACLMHSPAFKDATVQQQQQQQVGSPEAEQSLGCSMGDRSPRALKLPAPAAADAVAPQRLSDCTVHSPVASAAAEPGSDEGSYDPADMEPSKSPSPPPCAASPPAAAAAVAHIPVKSVGSGSSSSSCRKHAWTADQDGTVPAVLLTPSKLLTHTTGTAAAAVEDSKLPAEKRQKISHLRYSNRSHRRTSNAVLDLFGDVALLEGLQELRSPGSSSKPGGSSSSSGGRSGYGNSASGSGGCSGGVEGPGSGSSVKSDSNPCSASICHASAAPAAETKGDEGNKNAGGVGAMMSDRETTPEQDCPRDIHAVAGDNQQQQHAPSSDGGDSGLPGALAEMFEHLAADMARDGMLPGDKAHTAHAPNTEQTGSAAAATAAAGASSGSSRVKAREVAGVLGSIVNTAAAGAEVCETAGSKLTAAAGVMDRAPGGAVGATVAGIASCGVDLKQGLTRAVSMVVDDELVAAGSVPVGADENFAAALDTAALFAFAGDIE